MTKQQENHEKAHSDNCCVINLILTGIYNKVIGYLKVNSGNAQTELKDKRALEIERIYILKEYQGKKVGQLLCETALQIAKQSQADYIWLGVWEENHKAMNFYKKMDSLNLTGTFSSWVMQNRQTL
jgi:ribosomal protein S18 acetylase RimI-like enzyme